MNRYYKIKINENTFRFRLPVLALKKIQEKHGDVMSFISACGMDIDKMSHLLGLAANFKGNENPTTNGDAILEMLLDEGYDMVSGDRALAEVAYNIGAVSGVFSSEIADRTISEFYESINGALDEQENPTKNQ